jgi:uncharacterized Ntn-hydrolase superfamily protein
MHAATETYLRTTGHVWDRLVSALAAAQRAGGDTRGRQAAALLVVRADMAPNSPRNRLDLRVDDHLTPIAELTRLVRKWKHSELREELDRPRPLRVLEELRLRAAHRLLRM